MIELQAKAPRERMINRAIVLDQKIKQEKKELDNIKALLQAEALQEMENKNTKYVQYFGSRGSAVVSYKDKFEIDNYPLLVELVGKHLEDKAKREISVKVTLDDKVKKAIAAVYRKEARPHDIREILSWLGITGKQADVALKRVKGEYAKDLLLLESLGAKKETGLEEELDAIREQLNYELAEKYFEHPEAIDLQKLKRAVSIEETLAIGLNYEEGSSEDADD